MDERTAVEKLKEEINKKRMSAFSYLRDLARMDAKSLEMNGYRGKTNAEAVLIVFKKYDSEIEGMIRSFERQFPITK